MRKTMVFLCVAGFFATVCVGFVCVDSTMKEEGSFFKANTIFFMETEEKSITIFNETYYPRGEILERGIARVVGILEDLAKIAT